MASRAGVAVRAIMDVSRLTRGRIGKVIKTAAETNMNKTTVVEVARQKTHPKYGKSRRVTKKSSVMTSPTCPRLTILCASSSGARAQSASRGMLPRLSSAALIEVAIDLSGEWLQPFPSTCCAH
ncbi:uncharacterized protein AMSG_04982 [Thecamonas trahens ATCC 50062]|uniref:Uncharacterized protein n=1 Tax=Thecamonas trahens ATCC 50062 TaxID=461836 RepID=A0A0L0D830_THETB|nr:hypothetical protein AMSG_04982 [Thecamonas trahens ATCC 50062]KNC48537.1 hypothetical protein AMSG_04982 [Thecamonas trahens ATCC 50062]|eukprot:XP_013758644.1 hypothetical protein AMSG_04982 [Thecamonas trahens ATCC 50062]